MTLATLSLQIGALHAAYASGLSPAEVLAEVLRRLTAADDPAIFLHLRTIDDLVAEAAALGPFDPVAKPLWGIPFAIKDNIDLAGTPTTAACPAFAYLADEDAHVVSLLRGAGAIPIGKTNLDQFATGLVGVRSPYGVPRNALDPAIVPGGSSSGSAVAVARGIVSFALGTDTAGSGRVPAALNNIVGLKPTLGALSGTGLVPACRTLDTISVFAQSVPDAHLVFRLAAQYDPTDPYARPIATAPLAASPPNLRIGIPDAATRQFFGDLVQAASFEATVEALRTSGAVIVEIDFTPFFDVAAMLYDGAWVAERMTVTEALMQTHPEGILPVTRQIIGKAKSLSATDAFRGIYRLADLRRKAEPVLASIDMLCVPTIPTFYTLADLQADPIGPNSRLGTYTNFVNLLDLCGIAVPTAPRTDGRPGSVTLLARAGRDGLLASLADQIHRAAEVQLGATKAGLLPSALPAPAAQPDELAIAVVGAHMSGLPLNGQLTGKGGRFLEATTTAPDYSLFELPGGPPYRPGLLKSPGHGAAIALEIWALPRSAIGNLLAEIPAPLGLGTLTLADGRSVTGFLVEQHATLTAKDITSFKGWRRYVAETKG